MGLFCRTPKEALSASLDGAEELLGFGDNSYESLLDIGVVLFSSMIPNDNKKPPQFKSYFLKESCISLLSYPSPMMSQF